jgi:hypothetical protein
MFGIVKRLIQAIGGVRKTSQPANALKAGRSGGQAFSFQFQKLGLLDQEALLFMSIRCTIFCNLLHEAGCIYNLSFFETRLSGLWLPREGLRRAWHDFCSLH